VIYLCNIGDIHQLELWFTSI